ncbi:MAG: KR domain-containing protein, partial [Deltaproteobacteria bacterium]|nr:KR domain-containing protein [Deltaproteobacteria bacterium]
MGGITVLVTGATGTVGTYATYFLAHQGKVDHIYLLSRDAQKMATTLYNARIIAL